MGVFFFSSPCRKNVIFPEVTKYRDAIIQKPVPSFRVVYKKHTLTLDDLSTLADQNWLNDQVIIQHAKNFSFWVEGFLGGTKASVYAKCIYVLFLLKVMNMYGELIMESAHHKVILSAV